MREMEGKGSPTTPLTDEPPAEDSVPSRCSRAAYIYTPLKKNKDNIRIIELLPATLSEGFKCSMHEVPIGSEIPYEALSYTWEPVKDQRCIEVDGHCLIVGRNLFTALFHLRDSEKSRWLWIDAICINQAEVAERNHQVALMSYIYTYATRVIVWLGIEPVDKSINPPHPAGRFRAAHEPLDLEPEGCNFSTPDYVFDMLKSRWFTRGWVLQEVFHARYIDWRYGSTTLTWPRMKELAVIFARPNAIASSSLSLLSQAALRIETLERWRERGSLSHLQLEDVVFDTRYATCLDPRDKIFSVLSLATKKDGSLLFLPDYRLSPAEAEVLLAKSSLLEYQSLNVLRYVDNQDNEISTPSWVPHWSKLIQSKFRPLEEDQGWWLRDSAQHPPVVCCSEEQTIKLLLKGRILAQIGWIGDKDSISHPVENNRFPLRQHELESLREYRSHMNNFQGFYTRSHIFANSLSEQCTWWHDTPVPCIIWETSSRYDLDHIYRVESLIHGRCIAMTPDGYPAIVPRGTQPGDTIVAVYGIRNYFVIRLQLDVAENSGCYTLVGACKLKSRAKMDWTAFEADPSRLEDLLIV